VVYSFQPEQKSLKTDSQISAVTVYCKRVDYVIFQLQVNHLHSHKTVIQV